MKILKDISYEIIRFRTDKAFTKAATYSPNDEDEIRIDDMFGFVTVNVNLERPISFEVEIYVQPRCSKISDEMLIAVVEHMIFKKLKEVYTKK